MPSNSIRNQISGNYNYPRHTRKLSEKKRRGKERRGEGRGGKKKKAGSKPKHLICGIS